MPVHLTFPVLQDDGKEDGEKDPKRRKISTENGDKEAEKPRTYRSLVGNMGRCYIGTVRGLHSHVPY